jgi:hypothetical protein
MRLSVLAIMLVLSPVHGFAETPKRVDPLTPSILKEQRSDRCASANKILLHDCVKREHATGNLQNDSSVRTGRDTRQSVDNLRVIPNLQENVTRSDRVERRVQLFAELGPVDKKPLKPGEKPPVKPGDKPPVKPVKPDHTAPTAPVKPAPFLPGEPSKPLIPIKPVPGSAQK